MLELFSSDVTALCRRVGRRLICSSGNERSARLPRANGPPPDNSVAPTSVLLGITCCKDTIPQSAPDPALTVAQMPYEAGPAGDFPNHFFMNTRIDYFGPKPFSPAFRP